MCVCAAVLIGVAGGLLWSFIVVRTVDWAYDRWEQRLREEGR